MTGTLRKNLSGRWEIIDTDGAVLHELTSGDVIDVRIAGRWISTAIEHGLDYYATTQGVLLNEGLPARKGGAA